MVAAENELKSQATALETLTQDNVALKKIQAEHNYILDNSKVIKEKKAKVTQLKKEIASYAENAREKKTRNLY